MDRDIARERAGEPSNSASMTWPEFWSFVLATTAEPYPDGVATADHTEFYSAYIVQQRHEAGLPDLPDYPYAAYASVVIPPPKPDAISAPPDAYTWARRLCVETQGDPALAHAAAGQAGWLRTGPDTSGKVMGLRELELRTEVTAPGLQTCTVDDSAPDPQESNLLALTRDFARPPSDVEIGSASWSFVDDPERRRFSPRGANPAAEADRVGMPVVTVTWETKTETPSLVYARFLPAGSVPPQPPPALSPAQSPPNLQVDVVRRLCFATQGDPTRALALADEAGWRNLADLHFTRDKPDEASDRRKPPSDIGAARYYFRVAGLGAQWLVLEAQESISDFGGRIAFVERCSVLDSTKQLSGGQTAPPPANLQASLQAYFGRPAVITNEGVATWSYEDRATGPRYFSGVQTVKDVPLVIVGLRREGDVAVIVYERITPRAP
ncbi:MAG TPA: hypothetical protein VGL66_14960 [Caulobacteraceae bacterium]